MVWNHIPPCTVPRTIQFSGLSKLLRISSDHCKQGLLSSLLCHPCLVLNDQFEFWTLIFYDKINPLNPPPSLNELCEWLHRWLHYTFSKQNLCFCLLQVGLLAHHQIAHGHIDQSDRVDQELDHSQHHDVPINLSLNHLNLMKVIFGGCPCSSEGRNITFYKITW